jgi:uncharacterized damage-inducible protein DinB
MERVVGVIAAGVLVTGMAVAAGAQSRAVAAQPVSDAIRSAWETAKKNIHDSAVDVPEALYSFKPVDPVRTFGQIVAHTAGANYEFCAAARGEKTPKPENAFESLATKAAIVTAYDESVAYCDAAFKALTDRTAGDTIEMPFAMGKAARASTLIANIVHLSEHYGNLVTYMRLKGIVPPTSRPR